LGTEKRGFQGVHHIVTTHLCHCLSSATSVGVTLLQGAVGVQHTGRDRGRVTPANLRRRSISLSLARALSLTLALPLS
jgi:hypothetical protein